MSTKLMAPRKNRRNKASMAIAQAIIDEYQASSLIHLLKVKIKE